MPNNNTGVTSKKKISPLRKKYIRKQKFKKFLKYTALIVAIVAIIVTAYDVIASNTYNKLSSLGEFAVNEFIEMDIPKSFKFKTLDDTEMYAKDENIVLFSDGKTDLLFNISLNTDCLSPEEITNDLAESFKTAFNLDEVYISSISTPNELTIPIITFQTETTDGTRFVQYAIINSGYHTVLVSMNSSVNSLKTFSKIIGSVELI